MIEPRHATTNSISFDDQICKLFLIATIVWAAVAMSVGVFVAFQLVIPSLNLGLPYLSFGRLRPLHTNAAIFAFGGNAIFAGVYYSTERLLRTRMWSAWLSRFHFWAWQTIILAAALTLPFGITRGKEYAELEWPIAIAIAVVWVSWGYNFYRTLRIRREPHIYVAIWFYIATIITVAVLHVVNAAVIPVSFLKSYPVYAGVQDALVQWWYGHNAVAFFLTTPFLGLMYYFIPKAAGRPVYSYRLSIIHFWSLVFIYIWAGPHHLLYTALPNWAQTLGMVFSIMLWIPSWGGMLNGLLTLRGAWHKVKSDPTLKFLAASTIFYGMATFEGPLLSIKSVSSLAHYTDWIVGHVHAGTLGWNGLLTFGMIYYLVPRLWKTELYSQRLANAHFWIGTLGILAYVISLWVAGITQGMMWRAVDPTTGRLVYPDFVETVLRILPLYWVRAVGGTLYLLGFFLLIYNVAKTIARSARVVQAPLPKSHGSALQWKPSRAEPVHRILEGLPGIFSILTLLAILVGSLLEIVPMMVAARNRPYEGPLVGVRPYSSLELAGRDIYVREGCYNCHSQMIRSNVADVLRYGPASEPDDSFYDHPFQWGSKRTGPDLARVGGRYPDLWHFRHMLKPRDVVPQSIMPDYPWLFTRSTDFASLPRKLSVMDSLGVPYTQIEIDQADEIARLQARLIARRLEEQGAPAGLENREIVALIAYLQSLGQLGAKTEVVR